MNPLQIDAESTYHRQALLAEARAERELKQAGVSRLPLPLAAALAVAGLAFSLALRLKNLALASGAQGYLPNVHID
jgi:hypothetical protein